MSQKSRKKRMSSKFSKADTTVNHVEASAEKALKKESRKIHLRLLQLSLAKMKNKKASLLKFVNQIVKMKAKERLARLQNTSELMQIALDKKISELEFREKEKSMSLTREEELKASLMRVYQEEIQTLFFETAENEFKISGNQTSGTIKANMFEQLQLLHVVSKKIVESQMIKSITSMSLKSNLGDEAFSCDVVMTMDKKGYAWAMIFGKYIIPSLNNLISDKSGTMALKHIYNATKKTDTVLLSWSFKPQGAAALENAKIRAKKAELDRMILNDQGMPETTV